jgi:hypothetical protein
MDRNVAKVIIDNVNIEGLAEGLLAVVIKPAVDDLVAKTPTKIDDTIVALLYSNLAPQIVKAAKEKILEVLGE